MLHFTNLLYLFIIVINLCQFSISFNHRKYFSRLQTSVAMIANKNHDNLLDETMVRYGSIIHRKYVLTLAEILKEYQPEDVLLYINCYSDWFIFLKSCSSHIEASRFKFIAQESNSAEMNSKYGIIVLKEPILFIPRVQIISLPHGDDKIDESNCLIYSYIHHKYSNSFASYITPIKVQKKNDTYLPKLARKHRLIDGNDRELDLETIVSEVSFYGSPIICALKGSESYVQVGISNLKTVFHSAYSAALINITTSNPQIDQLSYEFSPEEITNIHLSTHAQFSTIYSVVNMVS